MEATTAATGTVVDIVVTASAITACPIKVGTRLKTVEAN